MTAILYINDNSLRLQRSISTPEEELIHSKGYAWFKNDQLVFDMDPANAPIKFCRIAPQEMNNRYWSQCDKSSIASNALGMRHAADLIWKHISELQKKCPIDELVLVVPSHYQSSNLQLLLGIFQSLDINVVGLVNNAVLSLQDKLSDNGKYAHFDMQLHQTVCSYIEVVNGIAKLADVEIIQTLGIQSVQDALLKALQTQFIQNDRFDPLHYAETEQQLFDALPVIAKHVNTSAKAMVNVKHQGQSYNSSIDAKVWNATLAPFMQELASISDGVKNAFLQTNSAFDKNALPLSNTNNLDWLEALLINQGLGELTQKESDGSVTYITELGITQNVVSTSQSNGVADSWGQNETDKSAGVSRSEPILTGATHLLQAGIAVPIEHCKLSIKGQQLKLDTHAKGNAQSLLESGKLFVMGDEECKEFRPNDRIGSHLADGVITVIQVV